MNTKPILVLTHGRDDCADLVLAHFKKRQNPVIRFNTEEFQRSVKVTMSLGSGSNTEGRFLFPDFQLPFDSIGTVWNRRVHEPLPNETLSYEPDLQSWATEESSWGLHIAISALTCPIVNPWEVNERLKFNKLLQMQRAVDCGFEVPATCISSDLQELDSFWNRFDTGVIVKKIRKGILHLKDGRRMLFHTTFITPEQRNAAMLESMRFTPVFMQEHIPKRYDIRSVIVGEQVFSVAIDSQKIPEGITDYRTASVLGRLHDMPHSVIDLGKEVNDKLLAFSRSFGLSFGAIDLIQTPDDRIVFLEDNPNGQWAWLEHMANVPISNAIADLLIQLASEQKQLPTVAAIGACR